MYPRMYSHLVRRSRLEQVPPREAPLLERLPASANYNERSKEGEDREANCGQQSL